ncbi:hypothetical protein LSCM1_04998 [Leishmania martiniquensis]|uniref:Uncharacterized protein n=1 Tax=Leishmania martiniquensis TaxID=1580590 RepID=A0A836G980_9TRYP|nr:hypothetical protein LSCM1_04998 [Leishmania martiniquensis]
MDKAKTLEVLRGMKFMQRKEEAKRRAAFEVAQREEIERQLLHPSAGNSGASGGGSSAVGQDRGGGKSRVTVLYDDAFPARAYGMSRRRFTETVSDGGTSSIAAELGNADVSLRDGAVEPKAFQKDAGLSPTSAYAAPEDSDVTSGDEVEDLWGSVDEEADANDPTAAPRTRRQGGEKGRACREDHDQHVRGDGRFTVKSSLRAPKVPRRLQENVEEQERQRKRRRAEGTEYADV